MSISQFRGERLTAISRRNGSCEIYRRTIASAVYNNGSRRSRVARYFSNSSRSRSSRAALLLTRERIRAVDEICRVRLEILGSIKKKMGGGGKDKEEKEKISDARGSISSRRFPFCLALFFLFPPFLLFFFFFFIFFFFCFSFVS